LDLVVDFETTSLVDLPRYGLSNYAAHMSTDILMMGYKELGSKDPVSMWFPPRLSTSLYLILKDAKIHAFNAQFEWVIWHEIGVRKYGFPTKPLKDFHCISALANRFGFPNKLEQVAHALGCRNLKNPAGEKLIKIFSCNPKTDRYGKDWDDFVEYCKDDVVAEEEIILALPTKVLEPKEQESWLIITLMNADGIPVAVGDVSVIRETYQKYIEDQYSKLPALTGGKISTIKQNKRIVDYCNARGYALPNCQAATVEEWLTHDLPEDIATLLEMRAAIGASSIGKYTRFEEMATNGRLTFTQRYHGALTGRTTGQGAQPLNLPRASVPDPDAEILKFYDESIMKENPVQSARALLRPMIAASTGHTLCWADWSSIEYVLIEWFADNIEALQRFKDGFDQYIDEAAALFKLHYGEVLKNQRQFGKVAILGYGYGAGEKRIKQEAKKSYGLSLTEEEALRMKNSYRKKHWRVVRMWYDCFKACKNAIVNHHPFEMNKCVFDIYRKGNRKWLTIKLPSGRKVCYYEPNVIATDRGYDITYMGYDQKTKTWCPQKLIPGKIVENIVQATARDILNEVLSHLRSHNNPRILWTTYDEIIVEVPEEQAKQTLEYIEAVMCVPPSWAKGLPLRTEGTISKRYKK